jgi:hypothetical protein
VLDLAHLTVGVWMVLVGNPSICGLVADGAFANMGGRGFTCRTCQGSLDRRHDDGVIVASWLVVLGRDGGGNIRTNDCLAPDVRHVGG